MPTNMAMLGKATPGKAMPGKPCSGKLITGRTHTGRPSLDKLHTFYKKSRQSGIMAFQISRVGQPLLATKNQLNFLHRLQKTFFFQAWNSTIIIIFVRFTEAPAESDFPRKFKVRRVWTIWRRNCATSQRSNKEGTLQICTVELQWKLGHP